MSVCKLLIFYFSINFGTLVLLLEVSPENDSQYYVTSSKIGELQVDISKKLQEGYINFKIIVEPHLEYELCIKKRVFTILDDFTHFKSFENDRVISLETDQLQQTLDTLVEGFIRKGSKPSYAVGYIKNVSFYGTIDLAESTFFIVDLENNKKLCDQYKNTSYNALVYKTENFKDRYYGVSSQRTKIFKRSTSSKDYDLFRHLIGNGKVCSLFILIDNSFLKILHKGDIKSALAQVLHTLDEVNSIFRSTDFDEDGAPDNIGFYVKYLIILQADNTLLSTLPPFSWQPIDGRIYTMRFSQYLILNEVCLGIAFTAQPFRNQILGLSYTAELDNEKTFKVSVGGICDRMPKRRPLSNFNTLVVTGIFQNGKVIPQHIMDLSLAHELGHSFGSLHDNTEECHGYIMSSQVPKEFRRQRYTFSSCSKKAIVRTLVERGHCLQEEENSFCGNGKVESGEVCDCGTVRDCVQLDVCCIPRGQSGGCQVNYASGYECHPSQGICCTDKCLIKNLNKYDLDCRNFNKTCPCEKKIKSCSCGVDGICTNAICSSSECTRIHLEECECPLQDSLSNCSVCCRFNNHCLSSAKVTEIILTENLHHLRDLKNKNEENTSKKYGFYRKICNGSECVNLFFRSVEIGDYCLLFGKVGVCNFGNQCSVEKKKHVYPTLRSSSNNIENSAGLIIFSSQSIYVILMVIGYFGNIFRLYISLFNWCP